MSHSKATMHRIRFLAFVRLSLCPLVSKTEFDTVRSFVAARVFFFGQRRRPAVESWTRVHQLPVGLEADNSQDQRATETERNQHLGRRQQHEYVISPPFISRGTRRQWRRN